MVAQTNTQFELLRAEIAGLRAEMREGFSAQRDELGGRIDGVSRRIDDTRRDMFNGFLAVFGSQVAILAVLLAQSLF